MIFEELEIWTDPVRRGGPEAMAVDEWLCETRETPLLRIYQWEGNWGSLGFFTPFAEAEASMDGVEWVRRRTGGGVVDHRLDWTYSLIVPVGCEVARMRGGESYRAVHEVLVRVLGGEAFLEEGAKEGRAARNGEKGGGGGCFSNPVRYDVMGDGGVKISGAAQRRTRRGLLHQGSVRGRFDDRMGMAFARGLAGKVVEVKTFPDTAEIDALVASSYGTKEWLMRR